MLPCANAAMKRCRPALAPWCRPLSLARDSGRAAAHPYHNMPYLILSGQHVRDVSAYILSLQD
jgi:hypothetical protein